LRNFGIICKLLSKAREQVPFLESRFSDINLSKFLPDLKSMESKRLEEMFALRPMKVDVMVLVTARM
jgi:hypothetical protein